MTTLDPGMCGRCGKPLDDHAGWTKTKRWGEKEAPKVECPDAKKVGA
jgi:hypothetical protein